MARASLLLLALVAALSRTSSAAAAPTVDGERPAEPRAAQLPRGATVTYPFAQRRYLYSRDGEGARAYVPAGVAPGASLPVVVFLHGMNKAGRVHPHLDDRGDDLRPLVDELVHSQRTAPFVLAAPTHTRYAYNAHVMFPAFDLSAFLDATDGALGELARVDRSRIIVVGHSGGGCNKTGGLFAVPPREVRALVAVDTCLEPELEPLWSERITETDVRVYWQPTWARPWSSLAESCERAARSGHRAGPGGEELARCRIERLDDLEGAGSPHARILPEALRRALPELLPPGATRSLAVASQRR